MQIVISRLKIRASKSRCVICVVVSFHTCFDGKIGWRNRLKYSQFFLWLQQFRSDHFHPSATRGVLLLIRLKYFVSNPTTAYCRGVASFLQRLWLSSDIFLASLDISLFKAKM